MVFYSFSSLLYGLSMDLQVGFYGFSLFFLGGFVWSCSLGFPSGFPS